MMITNLDFMVGKLRQGEVIAYPTEAVFGLGCDPDNLLAIEKLLTIKQRPREKGLILVGADYEQLKPYVDDSVLTKQQLNNIFSCWPGPVTWVIPSRLSTSKWLTGRFNSLAVRVSDHSGIQQLCKAFGKPLVSTSANLNGEEPCRTLQEVKRQFGENFPVLEGSIGERQKTTEIRDALSGKLIRQG